jgi:lipocalin
MKIYALTLLAALLAHSLFHSADYSKVNNQPITSLDVKRYMGKWYEIARFNHSFEKGMTHVMTEYTLLPDGKIQVLNQGMKNGEMKKILGKAKQPHPEQAPGQLKVSFFLWFYSDYNIMELDPDYQYALVGSSSDKYLWILSRTPEMPKAKLDEFLQIIRQRGYDPSKLIWVKQGD